jgi:hypothetical protein
MQGALGAPDLPEADLVVLNLALLDQGEAAFAQLVEQFTRAVLAPDASGAFYLVNHGVDTGLIEQVIGSMQPMVRLAKLK